MKLQIREGHGWKPKYFQMSHLARCKNCRSSLKTFSELQNLTMGTGKSSTHTMQLAISVSFKFLMWLCFPLLFRCGAWYKMVGVGAAFSPAQADQMKVKMPPVPTFSPTCVFPAAILIPALVYFWISDLTDFWERFRKGGWLSHWDTKSLLCILSWSASCWAGVQPFASVDGNGSFSP